MAGADIVLARRVRDERILKKFAELFGEDSEDDVLYLPIHAPNLKKQKKKQRQPPMIQVKKQDVHPHQPTAPQIQGSGEKIIPVQPAVQKQEDITSQVRASFVVPKQPIANDQLAREVRKMYRSGRSTANYRKRPVYAPVPGQNYRPAVSRKRFM
ncbi:hypothetical protein TSAR_008787 [Trichomalopsis sarcophagae]|uniref:Uncharacterized protein n=1 Tax=Trichomalopsis sarcophagae TaxID=543379 RepID=A0A232FFV7_9HYME|nr:hypothetical protein TSAR_008787 [Trichomalopsis sarcophagae]